MEVCCLLPERETWVIKAKAGCRGGLGGVKSHPSSYQRHYMKDVSSGAMARVLFRPKCGSILLLFTVLYTLTAFAQQALPQISYEGQPISVVDLVARPTLNVQPLRALLKFKPNEPFSAAKIRSTAAALESAGHFTAVNVRVSPEADGLHVRFLLEPVYYIGIISFHGAPARFDYPRLFQIVDYPSQVPYEQRRLKEGARDLRHFFVHEGYFLAQAQEHTELDSHRQLANLIYHITPGKLARFGAIEVAGPPPAEAARIKASLHSIRALLKGGNIKPGKPYHPGRIAAASRIIREYAGNHQWLDNRVSVARPQYDSQTNRALIRFKVTLGPKVQIRVTGARISHKALADLIPIYEEGSFDQDLVEEGERNLEIYFQAKGYFDVKVNPEVRKNPSEISLIYQIERGNRHTVARISFSGNQHADEDSLDPEVVIKQARFFFFSHGTFSDSLLKQSVRNLIAFYHDAGFEDVKVQPKVIDLEPKVLVTFEISEGAQTLVNALTVTGLKTQNLATLAPRGLSLNPGKPFSPSTIAKDRNRLVASYMDLGYLNVGFQARVSPLPNQPHRVNVTYIIQEGSQSRVRSVEILGERQTRPSFIKRNVDIQPSEPLSERKRLEAESALYSLGIFDWAQVGPKRPLTASGLDGVSASAPRAKPAATPAGRATDAKSPATDPLSDLLVKVHESKRNTLTYGFGFIATPTSGTISTGILSLPGLPAIGVPSSFRVLEKNLISPEGSIGYSRSNLFGRDETASISTRASRLDQQASFTYTIPEFRSLHWSSLVSLSAERTTINPLFTARLGQASFQLDRALNAAKTEHLQFRYSFQSTSLSNLLIQGFVPAEDQSIRDSTLSASFVRDTRDQPLNAHRGIYETLSLDITPKAFGSSENFARFFGQAAAYRRVAPWMVWANSFRLGLEAPFAGSHVPLSDRFFSGGADSLRGFPINGAGPQTVAILCSKQNDPSSCTAKVLVPVGGPQLLILNSEGRFPIPIKKNLGGVIFYDGGNVYSSIGFNHFFSQYTNTVGFGLRYNTPVGPIRIDFGRNLNAVAGMNATQIFVTLGQAF